MRIPQPLLDRRPRVALIATVAVAALASLVPSAWAGGNTWAGTWDSNWNTMTLTGDAQGFSGSYTWDDGRIRGTLADPAKRLYVGTWDEAPSRAGPSDAGDIEFTLAADGKSFSGRWRYAGAATWGDWVGTCVAGPCLNNTAETGPPVACPLNRQVSSPTHGLVAAACPTGRGLGIEYELPSRFGQKGKNGLVRYRTTRNEIHAKKWIVNFTVTRKDGKRCKRGDVVRATARKATFEYPNTRNPCRFVSRFSKEGTYTVKVVLKPGNGTKPLRASRQIVVQDWLIFGLGDSNGSGEGSPDRPIRGTREKAVWQDRHCHRSANSYQPQAALQLEKKDPRSSVTFVHLACSGAKIREGMLGTYGGIEPGRKHPWQIGKMVKLAKGREIDAVIISIGVNDLGFGEMVKDCVKFVNCPQDNYPHFYSSTTRDQVMRMRIARLINVDDPSDNGGLYDRLAKALKKAKIPARRVFITEYFDSTRDQSQVRCNPLISAAYGARHFDQDEATWAGDVVLAGLNRAVRAAATKHGWRLVAGAEELFRPHGYCSTDSWIVTREQSIARQGNQEGTLHSNAEGYRQQATLAKQRIETCFYPKNRIRQPGKKASRDC